MKQLVYILICLCLMPANPRSANADGEKILTGAGATFPQPLYNQWIAAYQAKRNVKISYLGGGSGKGIAELMAYKVDFGATDAFMSDEESNNAPGTILHIPTCVGAVTIIYNLPGHFSLKLTPRVLTDIFSGNIKNWSDEAISSLNTNASLPDYDISVVHRSEASGTTYILTDYFSKVSPDWHKRVGKSKQVRWPTGVGVESNQGVAETVKKITGSIGYVELTYAKKQNLPVAFIRNKSGNFIPPTLEAVSKAADVDIPTDTRIFITDTAAPEGYPISGFTWLIFFKNQKYNNRTPLQADMLADFLRWAIVDGQAYNESLFYAHLPKSAVKKAESIIASMTYGTIPLIGH